MSLNKRLFCYVTGSFSETFVIISYVVHYEQYILQFFHTMKTKYRSIKSGFKLKKTPLFNWLDAHEPVSAHNTIPLTWARAKNFSVWDGSGNKFIDFTSGIFVANAGHNNPHIARAVKKQVDDGLLFAYNYPTSIKEKFERTLLSLAPKHFNAMALQNSGSEAMQLVYKILKLYGNKTGKRYIVTFTGNYHGRGLSNDFISGNKEKASWSRVVDKDIVFLDFPYSASTEFDSSLLPPPDKIAGFILETFQGWGLWMYPKPFLTNLVTFARKHGALICFDDMQAGFYRMGPLFGYMSYGNDIKPDILALGKGISSSLPLGAVLSRKELFDIDPKADMYGTHSGNAVVLAAALANIKFLSSSAEIARRKKTTSVFEKEMKSLSAYPFIKQVNVHGLVGALIFERKEDATKAVVHCIERGVLPVCTNRESVKFGPPLTITPDAIREAFTVVREVLAEMS